MRSVHLRFYVDANHNLASELRIIHFVVLWLVALIVVDFEGDFAFRVDASGRRVLKAAKYYVKYDESVPSEMIKVRLSSRTLFLTYASFCR